MEKNKLFSCIIMIFFSLALHAQEGKYDYTRPNLNTVAPELQVEEWLSELPDVKGKFVIWDFWATYCGPCRESIPLMEKIADIYKNDLVVISIAGQSADVVRKVCKQEGLHLSNYQATDAQKRTLKACKINGIPHIIIIDPNGIVRWEGNAVEDPRDKGKELTVEKVGEIIKKYKPKVSDGFVIEGKVIGHYYDEISLITHKNGKKIVVAKAKPNADNTFQLQGKLSTADSLSVNFMLIQLEGSTDFLPLFIENGTLTNIDLHVENLYNSKILSDGSAQTLSEQFYKIFDGHKKRIQELEESEMPKFAAIINSKAQLNHEDSLQLNAIMSSFHRETEFYNGAIRALVKAHPNHFVTGYVLAQNIGPETDMNELKKLYSFLGEKIQKSESGQYIVKQIEKSERFAPGKVAPDFTLPTLAGDTVTMSKIPGKLKLIDFWASWCGPCRAENPNVVALYNEYHDKGLTIIGVSLDKSKMAWKKAVADDGITWIQVSDLLGWKSPVIELYGVEGVPCIFLLDENNKIIAVNLRGEELVTKVREILSEP